MSDIHVYHLDLSVSLSLCPCSEKKVYILQPRTREDFLQYSCQLTLDPNTVNKHLRLSEGNREVTHGNEIQSYPDHPERFDYWFQVLCREGLSGRCYWEAEWSGYELEIVVSYIKISAGKGMIMSVIRDVMISLGVCAALAPVTLSGTIIRALKSCSPPPPE
ncbi:hypothetical protein ANANG_G00075790 [Anguilla anguilla]|uniref:SPRY-associated domain-containing protein n=1 Tax=Anguilla anguilla TaxID=7936 RepID=A0A9D3S099_ANGAN|nr:hypothetical protein ANANG_G00075790 [Anguilla anguilla]